MNAAYHQRFFSDIRFTTLLTLGLFAFGLGVDDRMYLAIPIVALIGACQTAFDANYLIFSRHYAARLERFINTELDRDILVAHRMEDVYLFPLDRPKLVTVAFGRQGFSWFGFMTVLYTLVGAGTYAVGLTLSLGVIEGNMKAGTIYLVSLASVTVIALVVGVWWFPAGEGERRLSVVLDTAFGSTRSGRTTA